MDEKPGFTPDEIERGDDQAWHVPIKGCLVGLIVLLALIYSAYRFLIWKGIAFSAGL
jgi:hypothetical protein